MTVPTNAILRIVGRIVMPDSVIAQNVWYLLFDNDGASADEDDVVDDCADWLDDIFGTILSQLDTELTPSLVQVYIYDSVDDDWDEVGTSVMTWTPASAQEMLPHGVAAILHARTVDPDVLATKYIAGLTEPMQDASNWGSGTTANLLLAGLQWVTEHIGSATGSSFQPGVWSVAQTAFKAFTGTVSVNGDAGYQRRRKPGVGT